MKCQIHGVKKIEMWISKHGGGSDDKSVLKSDFRHLIRAESKDDYQLKLMNVVTRWSQAFISYFMQHIAPDIEMFALWTAKSWNYPTTPDSVITSNQCEHINRLAAEQQNWTELPVDTVFYIGRDLQKAKLVEIARGMMGVGNFKLLPEFSRKFNSNYGENLLRRIGSTPSYDQIIAKYITERDQFRHAGFGRRIQPIDAAIPVEEENLEDSEEEGNMEGVDRGNIDEFEDGNGVAVSNGNVEDVDNGYVELGNVNGYTVEVVSDRNVEVLEDENIEVVAEERIVEDIGDRNVNGVENFEINVNDGVVDQSEDVNHNESICSEVRVSEDAIDYDLPIVEMRSNEVFTEQIQQTPARSIPVANYTPRRSDVLSTPSISSIDLDAISYVPELDTYLLPGRVHPVSVHLGKKSCSLCGVKPRNWCSHMRSAALKAGVKVPNTPVFMKSLTQLRKNQRPDKNKSGRKAPRTFDLIPVHELNSAAESEEIQLNLALSQAVPPRSTVDDVIESVVQQAYTDQTLWCLCQEPSSGDMIGCDGPECQIEWFHFTCVQLEIAPEGDWFCTQCKPKTSKRKLNFDKNPRPKKLTKREKCPECNIELSSSYLKTHIKKFCVNSK